jgi:hypothetical protein
MLQFGARFSDSRDHFGQSHLSEKPVMQREQLLWLLKAIANVHGLCLLYIAIFCDPRSSEVIGLLEWQSPSSARYRP